MDDLRSLLVHLDGGRGGDARLVLGQRDPADDDTSTVPRDFVEAVIEGSGTPALVVPFGAPPPERIVVDHLRLHGVTDVDRHRTEVPRDLGESLLSAAAGVGADLLVMGCYGHSPARELVLGGATRTVLQGMHLPVLMTR